MLSPSCILHRLCVHSLPCTALPWGRATGDGHHPFIRLHHTGRAHPARLKRDTHFQGYAAGVASTCHAGLLAPGARGFHGVAHFGAVPREIRPRPRVAVVFVEYLSRTLSASWQLCRKCSCACVGRVKRLQIWPSRKNGTRGLSRRNSSIFISRKCIKAARMAFGTEPRRSRSLAC